MKTEHRTLVLTIFSILLFAIILSPLSSAHGVLASAYAPGVAVGEWAGYGILYNHCESSTPGICDSLTSGFTSQQSSGVLQVVDASMTTVTLRGTSTYSNETSSAQGFVIDVSAGTINGTTVSQNTPEFFVTATNLHKGEQLWNSNNAPTINDTITENILGSSRTLNFYNHTLTTDISFSGVTYGSITSSLGVVWDQASGFLVEFSTNTTSYSSYGYGNSKVVLDFGMVSNHITGWRSDTFPDFTIDATGPSVTQNGSSPAHATSTITITREGNYPATITLDAKTSSFDLTCTLSQVTLRNGSSDKSTLDCTGPAGTYTVTITASSGYSSHSKQQTVAIPNSSGSSSSSIVTQPTILGGLLNPLLNPFVDIAIAAVAVIIALLGILATRRKPTPLGESSGSTVASQPTPVQP